MNIYERPTGLVKFPDTGDFVEVVTMGTKGNMRQGSVHFVKGRPGLCLCHDQIEIRRKFRALAYRENHDRPQEIVWPERESLPEEDDGPDALAFTSIASRALMGNAHARSMRYGTVPGYLVCGQCNVRACNCDLNLVAISQLFQPDEGAK